MTDSSTQRGTRSPGAIRCPMCGAFSDSRAQTCQECGGVFVFCGKCDTRTVASLGKCHNCGTPVRPGGEPLPKGASPPAAQEPASALSPRPAPPSQAERRSGGSPAGGGRRPPARPARGYFGAAFLTWILYYLGCYVVGLILNFVYLRSAGQTARQAGRSPSGRGCLRFLFLTHFWLPLFLVCALVGLALVGVLDWDTFEEAVVAVPEGIIEMIDDGEFSLKGVVELVGDLDWGFGGRPRILRGSGGSRSGGGVDPWEAAVAEASRALQQRAEFEDNLRTVQEQAQEISRTIAAIDKAKPLLQKVEELEAAEIPLLGNGWDLFLGVCEASAPGSGDAVEELVSLLRRILAFKQNLDRLEGLGPVAEASQAFRDQPSPASLRALASACSEAAPGLVQVDADVQELSGEIAEVLDTAGLLQQGLSDVGGLLNAPIVSDSIRSFNRWLDEILSPLGDLQAELDAWHRRIQADLQVMDTIQGAVDKAER